MAKQTSITSLITKVNAVVMFADRPKLADVRNMICKLESEYLTPLCDNYGLIVHDRDTNEDGIPKKLHVHAVFTLRKRKRKSTVINDLASYFGVSSLGVSVDAYQSFEGSFQYLIHKNDPNKYQYDAADIVTNLDESEIDLVLEEKTSVIDFKALKAFCLTCENKMDVIEYVGIPAYARYWKPIDTIYECCRQMRETSPLIPRDTDF